jgi:hypothetical protein
LVVINQLNNPSNQGEGEAFGSDLLVGSSPVFALPDHAADDQGLGYGEALANYVLQREDVASTQPLRTRLSSLVAPARVDVDAYRMAYETALADAGDDQIDFADADVYDVLAQDSLYAATDDEAIFGGDQDWL